MGLLAFILLVVVVGFVVYAVNRWAPIPQEFKTLILWAAIIVLVIILLGALGLFNMDIQIPHIR